MILALPVASAALPRRALAQEAEDAEADIIDLEDAEEVVVVEAEPDRSTAAAQLMIRKSAANVGDAVGREELAKTPDRNAADATKRVVGATVVGHRYVYVRGLGERYTNALLDGSPLPSPEPDRQAVPLDLFPTIAISDITVVKSATPDMPADFAGGSVRIRTRELPPQLLFQATLSVGFNTQSTFADRLSYQGSSTDWLGVDGGARALPGDIPDTKVGKLNPKADGSLMTKAEADGYGRSINAYMTTRPALNLPNGSGSLVVGDSWSFGGDSRLGALAALTYGRKFSTRKGEIVRTYAVDPLAADGTLKALNDYTGETGTDQVSWGALASTSYRVSKDHEISLTGLTSRSSDNEARVLRGFNEERGTDVEDTRLRFVSRSLTFGQLRGSHTLRGLGDALVAWRVAGSYATSDEPDTRETVYVADATTGRYTWDKGTLSGSHFYGAQDEVTYSGGLDWTQPLVPGDLPTSLKAGLSFERRYRAFSSRRFRYLQASGADAEALRAAPDQLFTGENIGPNLGFEETTKPNDTYDAGHEVKALYLMADTRPTERLRFLFGQRMEASRQDIDSYDPYAPQDASDASKGRVQQERSSTDFLPSVSVIVKSSERSNVRASLARTLARPTLRELSPFSFTDYFGARDIEGNPDLQQTSIYNADLRFEVFPGTGEVLAASVFYKQFDGPIETIIKPSGRGIVSYANADAAYDVGVELEAKKGLGFLDEAVADLGVFANLTLVYSRVSLGDETAGIQTSAERPLAGQSPYVVNAGIDYANERTGTRARLLYNVAGARIAQVGSGGLPDVYEQPRHQLDATVAQKVGEHIDIKLAAENIIDAPVRFTQGEGGDDIVNEHRTGTTVSVGGTYTF